VPAVSLPRPTASSSDEQPSESGRGTRATSGRREHHVTTDYSYVHRDLITVAVVGVVVIAFIIGMSYLI
jgi:hypothetical protein